MAVIFTAIAYFATVFSFAFAMGVARILVVAPRLGATAGTDRSDEARPGRRAYGSEAELPAPTHPGKDRGQSDIARPPNAGARHAVQR